VMVPNVSRFINWRRPKSGTSGFPEAWVIGQLSKRYIFLKYYCIVQSLKRRFKAYDTLFKA
jgi:hypothetical protein